MKTTYCFIYLLFKHLYFLKDFCIWCSKIFIFYMFVISDVQKKHFLYGFLYMMFKNYWFYMFFIYWSPFKLAMHALWNRILGTLSCNLWPAWRNLAPSRAPTSGQQGPSWPQVGAKMASCCLRTNQKGYARNIKKTKSQNPATC